MKSIATKSAPVSRRRPWAGYERRVRILWAVLIGVALAGVVILTAGAGRAYAQEVAFTCDRWASVNGNDANEGTQDKPVQTVRTLANKLQPGQTGCLTAGETFHMESGWGVISNSGLAGSPITIRSAPEGRATLTGQMRIDGDYLVVRDIDFRGLAALGNIYPKSNHIHVVGDDVSLINNDITSPKGICVFAGTIEAYLRPDDPGQTANSAKNFKLDGNKIYGCGVETTLVSTDSGMHGVYLGNTEDAKVTNNYIYDNRTRGLQLYPRAERTLVEYNVLDGNSGNLNIGGSSHEGGYYVSRDTTVRNNIISNSTFGWHKDTAQVFGNYAATSTSTQYNNDVSENCVYHQDPTKNFGGFGYSQTTNKTADPLYKDRANKNFALAAGSLCADKGPQTAPSITNVSPVDLVTSESRNTNIEAAFSEPMNPKTLKTRTFTLTTKKGTKTVKVAGTVSYDATTRTLTLNPKKDLLPGTYTATVVGGSKGVKSTTGATLAQSKSWSFTVQ